MNERLQFTGRLRENELKAKSLAVRIKGLIDSLRTQLDPFAKYEDLETEIIAAQAMELATAQIEYKGLLDGIKAIKKALGKE